MSKSSFLTIIVSDGDVLNLSCRDDNTHFRILVRRECRPIIDPMFDDESLDEHCHGVH